MPASVRPQPSPASKERRKLMLNASAQPKRPANSSRNNCSVSRLNYTSVRPRKQPNNEPSKPMASVSVRPRRPTSASRTRRKSWTRNLVSARNRGGSHKAPPHCQMTASPIDWTSWQGVMLATLMFVVRDGQVLLIEKKRGLGAGKINGPGGKIEPGETPMQAVIRETQEELCITPHAPRKLGELWFAMSDHPDILCHVFRSDQFSGIPTETAEATPLWTPRDAIPYHLMWADDRHWLPLVLEQRPFLGRFVFAAENLLWSEILHGTAEWGGTSQSPAQPTS